MGNEETRDLLIIYGSMFVVFIVVFALIAIISQKRKELYLKRMNNLMKAQNDKELRELKTRIKKLEKLHGIETSD